MTLKKQKIVYCIEMYEFATKKKKKKKIDSAVFLSLINAFRIEQSNRSAGDRIYECTFAEKQMTKINTNCTYWRSEDNFFQLYKFQDN